MEISCLFYSNKLMHALFFTNLFWGENFYASGNNLRRYKTKKDLWRSYKILRTLIFVKAATKATHIFILLFQKKTNSYFNYKGILTILIHLRTVNILCLNHWKVDELRFFLILCNKKNDKMTPNVAWIFQVHFQS